jgi:hypothetical protein
MNWPMLTMLPMRGWSMTAAELRREAQALREFLIDNPISPSVREQVQTLISELEAQAAALGNGDGTS